MLNGMTIALVVGAPIIGCAAALHYAGIPASYTESTEIETDSSDVSNACLGNTGLPVSLSFKNARPANRDICQIGKADSSEKACG